MNPLTQFLLETTLRFLLGYLTDPENQKKAKKFVKTRVDKKVKSRSKKWTNEAGQEALKFFNMQDES